jgi:hypothetical protein
MSRGFGSPNFPRHLQREICAKGGRAAQATGRIQRWTRAQAAAAGRKSAAGGRGHRFNEITGKQAGRLGGLARAAKAKGAGQ